MRQDRPLRLIPVLLGIWALAVGAAGVVALTQPDDGSSVAAVETTTSTTHERGHLTPAANQLRVMGLVGEVRIEGVLDQAIDLPLTFVPVDRGLGNGGKFDGIIVDGHAATVVWDGGRSLLLTGDHGLDSDPATFVLGDGVVHGEFGGVVLAMAPGDYRIDAPVALGQGGLAEPRDVVSFHVPASATAAFTGALTADLPKSPLRFVGPGRVVLSGLLEVERPDGTMVEARRVELPAGQFELIIEPFQKGFTVEALLQGRTTVKSD